MDEDPNAVEALAARRQLDADSLATVGTHRATPDIPEHQLLKRIGGGSYGEVWLARNVIGAYHAVKVVYRDAFGDARPFDREFEGIQNAMPISRTRPGLVHILQVGRNDGAGYFYYVMELADDGSVPGSERGVSSSTAAASTPNSTLQTPNEYVPRTLSNERKVRGPLPVEECIQLGLTLTSALAHLHEQGLVHRDIKPSNIIFVRGVPKLADIGLMADASAAQSFVGTAGFIPPEGPGSPQADLYSLGKVLYEISTGKDRQDFPELPVELIRGGAEAECGTRPAETSDDAPQSMPHSAPGAPRSSSLLELNSIIVKACETDFRQRYQTAQQMHDELALLEGGHSIKRKRKLEWRFALARKAALATGVMTLLVTIGWLLSASLNRFHSSTPGVLHETSSIAVLPFVNQDGWEPHEYLAAMLSDETRNALTNCLGLRVALRPSAIAFKRATNHFREIGEQLGVRTVLAGSMNKTSNQLDVTARLINAKDGAELWSATYRRNGRSTNIPEIASQVASNVAQVFHSPLPPSASRQTETNFTRKLTAYRFFGQALSNVWNTQEGNNMAVQLLNQAIAEDPECAHAYALLAFCYADASGWLMHPKQAMTAAKVNALRAVQLDDSMAKAHLSLAGVFAYHELEPTKADTEFQHALEVAPRDGNVYGYYAIFLSAHGQFHHAEEVLLRGDLVDPRSHNLLGGWCWHYYFKRHWARMLERADRLRTFQPDSIAGLMFQAKAHERLGHYEEALPIAQQMVQRDPSPDFVAFLGMVHGRMGHAADAQMALEKLSVVSDVRRGMLGWEAQVLLGLGRIDATIEKLRMAMEDYPPGVFSLKTDPLWDELRSNARFAELLKQMGVPK